MIETMVDDTRSGTLKRRRTDEVMYKVSWDSNGESHLVQSKPKTLLLIEQHGGFPNAFGATRPPSLTSYSQAQHLNPPQLTFQDLEPITDSAWSYTCFLGVVLGTWVLYLLVPRGFRKRFCGASRKRYARRTDMGMPAGGYWLPVHKMASKDQLDPVKPLRTLSTQKQIGAPLHAPGAGPTSNPNYNNVPITKSVTPPRTRSAGSTPPSPEHPALKKIPPNRIIAETMGRLQGRGIRLLAHGVQCEPKRVWIKLEEETTSVTWQTEFPRRVTNQSGEVSIVLMRGSLHRIALCNVLYIDVGKKTNALKRAENRNVPDTVCFSLLTQNGSLDLQANSKLERDSLVSCFSMILDDVHTEDWRALYEESPEPSMVTSGDETGTEIACRSDFVEV